MQGTVAHESTPPLVEGARPGEKFVLTIPEDAPAYPSKVAKYAAAAYGFLVPLGQSIALTAFADLIGQRYDLATPQNAEVVRALKM